MLVAGTARRFAPSLPQAGFPPATSSHRVRVARPVNGFLQANPKAGVPAMQRLGLGERMPIASVRANALRLFASHSSIGHHPFRNKQLICTMEPRGNFRVEGQRALSSPAEDDGKKKRDNFQALGVPVGSVAGVFGSILGVGGGIFMVPMMTCKPMELEARHASATSLVAVVGTGLVSAACYGFYGQLDPIGALVISSAAVFTAPAGARATMRISNSALKRLMGVFLILVAPSVFLRDIILGSCPKTSAPTEAENVSADSSPAERAVSWLKSQPGLMALPPAQQVPYVLTLVSAGGVAGFLSGLLGIGGGLIVTPIMALFSGMPQHAVVGTSMLAMIAPSSVSLYTHHTLGNVRWPVGRMLLLGSAFGAAAGVQLAQRCEDKTMKQFFAVGMFLLGVKSARG